MALDGIFLYHLKKEIESFAVGSRVDKIHQPSKDELIITLRSPQGSKKLLLSCNADCARVHYTQFPPENPTNPPMFCMLLRKRLSGAFVTGIEQDDLERVLKINFRATDDIGDKVNYSLIAEIMGRYSNIIFTSDNGVIVDSLKRVDESVSHIRQILPQMQYVAPPKQDKLNIFTDDINDIKARISSSTKGYAKACQDAIKGVSPIICRELEDNLSLEEFKEKALNPIPCIVTTNRPLDFAFINIKQYGSLASVKEYDTFSELLDYFYYEKVRILRVKSKSTELFKTLTTLKERAVRKVAARTQELEECKDKEKYKIYGDLITSNQYALQKGSLYYDLENYYNNNEVVRIPAQPSLTPSQNAQKYYKEYRKKQIAQTKLLDFIREANEEVIYFDTVLDALSRALTDSDITAIKDELALGGYIRKKTDKNKKNPKSSKGINALKFKTTDGFDVLVGKNNVMNDALTLKYAKGHDVFFHLQDAAASHIICVTNARQITDTAIHDCAVIAAYYSKARESSNVAIDYTPVKNIKKPVGAKPGKVIYDTYKTEFVTPSLEEVEKLKNE